MDLYGKIEDEEEDDDEDGRDLEDVEGSDNYEGGLNNLDGISDNDDDIDGNDDNQDDLESYIEIDTEEVFEQLSKGKAYVTFQGTYVYMHYNKLYICIVINYVYIVINYIYTHCTVISYTYAWHCKLPIFVTLVRVQTLLRLW